MKTALRVISLILFCICLCLCPSPASASSCSSVRDVMVVGAFVDIYGLYSGTLPAVLATSDGGAVYAGSRDDSGSPRVIKVNGNTGFEWFSEQRLGSGDSASYVYKPQSVVEDVSEVGGPYLYVGGYIGGGGSFIIKYRREDGTYVSSASPKKGTYDSYIYSLLVDSSGNLVFGGCYYNSGVYYAWAGLLDKSTFAVTEKSITSSSSLDPLMVWKIIEDTDLGHYVFVGELNLLGYLWAFAVDTATWTRQWEDHNILCVPSYMPALVKISAGKYGVHACNNYYSASSAGLSLVDATISSLTISPSTESGKVMLMGNLLTNSYAYFFDPVTDTKYNSGKTASHSDLYLYAGSASSDSVWAAGYVNGAAMSSMTLVRLQCVTPISCSSGTDNYLNKGCYSAVSSGCFGVCDSCYIANDINACASINLLLALTYQFKAISLYVGRCHNTGQFYRVSQSQCKSVTQSSCNVLCGGECFGASSASQCLHHCKGYSLEPNIDTSALASNTCGCKTGTTLSATSSRCVYTTGCYGLCSNGECGAVDQGQSCITCVSGSHIVGTKVGAYYKCECDFGYALASGACLACSEFCSGCTVPSDNTKCLACAAITDIVKTGSTSPFTCACPAGTVLSGSACLPCGTFCSECTVPADPTKCLACALISGVVATGSIAPYTCSCPAGTALSGAACLPCSQYCDGCTVPSDNSKCLACSATISGIVQSGGSAPYTCECPAGTTLSIAGTVCSSCSVYCNGCTGPSDNTKCLDCAAITSVSKTGSVSPYTCACPAGTVLSGSACLPCSPYCASCTVPSDSSKCILCSSSISGLVQSGTTCSCPSGTTISGSDCLSCSVYCAECSVPNDSSKCITCSPTITGIQQTGSICACPAGTVLSGSQCAACHPMCADCSAPGDQNSCVSCAAIENVEMISAGTCQCKAGTVYDSGLCVYTSGCSALCGSGNCLSQGDASACLSCLEGTIATPVGVAFTCQCPSATTLYNGTACVPILTSNCAPLCSSSGCVEPNNPLRCVSCVSQLNVISSVSESYYRSCLCAAGTVLVGTECVYTFGCHRYCKNCFSQSNSSACVQCVAGITPVGSAGSAVTCACPAGTAYYNSTCVSIFTVAKSNGSSSESAISCDPLCGNQCIAPADPTKCVLTCSNSQYVTVVTSEVDVVSCGCENGTHRNSRAECVLNLRCDPLCANCLDEATCVECPDQSTMVLSGGKCICATASGYVMITDGETGVASCVQQSTQATTVMQYTGYALMVARRVELR